MNQERQSKQPANKANISNRPLTKLTYHPPQFISYGSVSKLTRGGAGSVSDGGSGMFQPPLGL